MPEPRLDDLAAQLERFIAHPHGNPASELAATRLFEYHAALDKNPADWPPLDIRVADTLVIGGGLRAIFEADHTTHEARRRAEHLLAKIRIMVQDGAAGLEIGAAPIRFDLTAGQLRVLEAFYGWQCEGRERIGGLPGDAKRDGLERLDAVPLMFVLVELAGVHSIDTRATEALVDELVAAKLLESAPCPMETRGTWRLPSGAILDLLTWPFQGPWSNRLARPPESDRIGSSELARLALQDGHQIMRCIRAFSAVEAREPVWQCTQTVEPDRQLPAFTLRVSAMRAVETARAERAVPTTAGRGVVQSAALTDPTPAVETASAERSRAESDKELPRSRLIAAAAYEWAGERIPGAHTMPIQELLPRIREQLAAVIDEAPPGSGEPERLRELLDSLPANPDTFRHYLNEAGIHRYNTDGSRKRRP